MDCTPTRLFTTFLAEARNLMVTCCSIALPFPTHLQELPHYCRPTDLGNGHNYSSAPRYATLHGQHSCSPHVMRDTVLPQSCSTWTPHLFTGLYGKKTPLSAFCRWLLCPSTVLHTYKSIMIVWNWYELGEEWEYNVFWSHPPSCKEKSWSQF